MDEVPVGHAAILGRILAHGCDDDTVREFEIADADRGEESRLGHDGFLCAIGGAEMGEVRRKSIPAFWQINRFSSSHAEESGRHHTTGCVSPVSTLTNPSGARSDGATSTQRQGEQVSVANDSLSGKPGHQRGEKVGSYIQSMVSPAL